MAQRRPRGFSLIELMVGIVLAMIAVLVVVHTALNAGLSHRRTLSMDDAQIAGTSAMFALQRELGQAGLGLGDPRLLGCAVELDDGRLVAPLAPVVINPPGVPAGDAMSDTLLVAYGSDAGLPQGIAVSAQPAPAAYAVAGPGAFAIGDRVVGWSTAAGTAPDCRLRLAQVTAVAGTAPAVVQASAALAGAMEGGQLFNLGPRPRLLAYAVRGGQLTRCDFLRDDCSAAGKAGDRDVWVGVASHVVGLRAQYGVSHGSAADAPVDEYRRDPPADGCGWMHTPVLRVALLARSPQPEKEPVPQAAITWAGAGQAPLAVDLEGAEAALYHYRAYEATLPLRNIAWRQGGSSC